MKKQLTVLFSIYLTLVMVLFALPRILTYAYDSRIPIIEDGSSITYTWAVERALSLLPEELQEIFLDSDWEIHMTDMDLNRAYFNEEYTSVSGMTSYRQKRIYISDDYTSAVTAPFHEIGHWVDWASGYPSKSEEFQEIYQDVKEKRQQEKPTLALDTEAEIYADAVSEYYTDPESLKDGYPELYDYIDVNVQELYAQKNGCDEEPL